MCTTKLNIKKPLPLCPQRFFFGVFRMILGIMEASMFPKGWGESQKFGS
jgi:hypothetical protein